MSIAEHTTDWMETQSGARFWPTDPRPEDVHVDDIAHALSHICRYGGHVDQFYSVAEHCVLMSYAVAPENALHALLHDATEAYVGDMIRPLKHQMPDYRQAEDRVWEAIAARFAIDPAIPDEVHEVDTRILLDERAALKTRSRHAWGIDAHFLPLGVPIQAWSPWQAKTKYLSRLGDLLDPAVITPQPQPTTPGVACNTCGAPATYRLGMPTPAWCDLHGPHAATGGTALAEAWDDGFSACAGEHLKQRSDPTHPITRTNPHDTTPGGLIA